LLWTLLQGPVRLVCLDGAGGLDSALAVAHPSACSALYTMPSRYSRRTRYSVQRSRRARPSERPLVGSVMMHCIFCALLTSGSPLVGACVGCTCCELTVFDSTYPCLGDASAARLLRYGYTAVNSLFLFLTLSLHRPLSRAVSLDLSPSLSPSLSSSYSVSRSLLVG